MPLVRREDRTLDLPPGLRAGNFYSYEFLFETTNGQD